MRLNVLHIYLLQPSGLTHRLTTVGFHETDLEIDYVQRHIVRRHLFGIFSVFSSEVQVKISGSSNNGSVLYLNTLKLHELWNKYVPDAQRYVGEFASAITGRCITSWRGYFLMNWVHKSHLVISEFWLLEIRINVHSGMVPHTIYGKHQQENAALEEVGVMFCQDHLT